LPQTTVNIGIEEAYTKTKEALLKQCCTVVSEEQPKQLVVRQGSLWGISPRTAKKTITTTFKVSGDKTDITYSSKLSSDWKNVTIVGCVLAAALVALCVWMALDLSEFMTTGGPGFWAWLITSGDTVRFSAGQAFVNLAWGLSVFLIIVIVIEAAIYVYTGRNIEAFAQTTLAQLA
jgi:hypothetical protein